MTDVERTSEKTPVDLVERLRIRWSHRTVSGDGLLAEAANEIERLRAENADLRTLVEDLTHNMPHPTAEAPRW